VEAAAATCDASLPVKNGTLALAFDRQRDDDEEG